LLEKFSVDSDAELRSCKSDIFSLTVIINPRNIN
jgi:hypothetical protein